MPYDFDISSSTGFTVGVSVMLKVGASTIGVTMMLIDWVFGGDVSVLDGVFHMGTHAVVLLLKSPSWVAMCAQLW